MKQNTFCQNFQYSNSEEDYTHTITWVRSHNCKTSAYNKYMSKNFTCSIAKNAIWSQKIAIVNIIPMNSRVLKTNDNQIRPYLLFSKQNTNPITAPIQMMENIPKLGSIDATYNTDQTVQTNRRHVKAKWIYINNYAYTSTRSLQTTLEMSNYGTSNVILQNKKTMIPLLYTYSNTG